jgi:hypothetical protein
MDKQKAEKQRATLQLVVDRNLARRFRGFCMANDTSASRVITVWMEEAIRSGKLPDTSHVATKPRPARKR